MARDILEDIMRKLGATRRARTEPENPALSYDQMTDIIAHHAYKDFVYRLVNPDPAMTIRNPDGTISTHKMSWGEADGTYYVFPTVVRKDRTSKKLVELSPRDAFAYALESGEAIPFEDKRKAAYFSKHYKLTNFGANNIYRTRSRD